MPKRIFEFTCVKGHTTDKYIDESEKVIVCPHCGNDASRIISTPTISLEGITGHFPGAAAKWEQRRESHIKWERKTGRSEEVNG
jgi:hypothetical protein